MRFVFNEKGFKKGVALILVGTIAGCVSYGPSLFASNNDASKTYCNELLKGYYYDEDVKKNRQDIMGKMEVGGSAKIYEKKRDLCPKTIKK